AGGRRGATTAALRRRTDTAERSERPRYLALGDQRGEADPGQGRRRLEDEVAGLPAREELGVEPVEALDLVPAPGQAEQPADEAVEAAARAAQRPCERSEVEGHLLDAPVPQLLERSG